MSVLTKSLSDAERDWVYQRWPELKNFCPTCKVRFDDDDTPRQYRWKGQEHVCNCPEQTQLAKHYTLAGIGRVYQRLSWDDFTGEDIVLREVEHYLTNKLAEGGLGIIFSGDLGTGKTMIANLILKEMVRRGMTCYATTFAQTVESFTSTWGNREQKQWFADRFMYSQVLLLDDLGREVRLSNNLPQTTFDMILRTRVQDGRPTLLTTNIAPQDLDIAGYGGGVLSMLKGHSVVISMPGKDFRPASRQRTLTEVEAKEVRPIV